MTTAHQVAELALDLGAGGAVVGSPRRGLLTVALWGGFVFVEADLATAFAVGTLAAQRTALAVGSEVGPSTAVGAITNDDKRAGDPWIVPSAYKSSARGPLDSPQCL